MKGLLQRRSAVQRGVAATVLLAALLLILGNSFSPANLSLAVTISILFGLAQSWNILAGFGGQVSLAVGGLVGIGAYAATLAMLHLKVGVIPAIFCAGIAGAVIAAVIAFPLFRLRGNYFTIGTLTLALAVQAIIINWSAVGGSQGLSVPTNEIPTPAGLFRLAIIISAVIMIVAIVVRYSDFGLRLMAVRDHENAARSLGVATFRLKSATLVLSSALTAIVGALLALQQFTIEPSSAFSLTWTIGAVVMCVVGGLGTLLGPAIGTFVVYYCIQQQLQGSAALSTIVTGAVLLVVIRFAPEGLWPLAVRGARTLWSARRGGFQQPVPATAASGEDLTVRSSHAKQGVKPT